MRSSSGSRISSSATCPVAVRRAPTAARRPSPGRSPGPVPRGTARGPDRDRRAERRRQDDAPADDRRASCRRSTARSRSATHVQLGYLAQLRGAAIPGATVLDALLDAIPRHARRGARVPRAVPVPRRRRVQGGPARCRAASDRGSSSRCSGSCPRTCCCSTSRRTTSTSPPARRSRRSCARRRRRCSSCRTTGGCSRRSASGCGSSTTGRGRRSTAAIGRGARRSPTAGRWRRRAATRRRVGARIARADEPRARRSGRRPGVADEAGGARRSRRGLGRRRREPGRAVAKLSKDAYRRQRGRSTRS